ncbi:FeoA family protein [Thalassomonas actiniarum]|uniref:Ferrous iron transport protein A n=1 Tax=Thalassomonas actiniarum TaxID=485447 RepID=A0AAF0C319_9GAMM|nr:FeoA family protein [Thalassomonas actiniarum]WDD98513.1 ferrous iron transport protein A [Thalassomonas actiniarum]
MTLAELKPNQKAVISRLPEDLDLAALLLEQGFVPDSEISLAHKAPFNGPMAFRIHNTKISIGQKIAGQIKVEHC